MKSSGAGKTVGWIFFLLCYDSRVRFMFLDNQVHVTSWLDVLIYTVSCMGVARLCRRSVLMKGGA